MVPISIQYWYRPKAAKGEPVEPEPEEDAAVNYVTKIMKDRLWESLIPHFTLPATESLELAEAQKEKVREWALKKMAAQFNNHKKRLWNAYVKADRQALEFTGPNENLRDHWDAFVEYNESELGKLRSKKIRSMPLKRNITIQWVQVATRLPSLSGICKRPACEKKASNQKQNIGLEGQEIGHLGMGLPTTREQGN
jgi:hypothetical protein